MANDYHQELIPGAYYHIYNRAVAGESIFSSKLHKTAQSGQRNSAQSEQLKKG
jgi:hypothetical protein